jgi:tetratricopeptide (TPR) repeat protein
MKDVFRFKILFYVVLMLCSCKSVKTKNEDLAKTIKESDILIRNNRLTEAQEKLSLLHKIYPNNIEVAKKLGLVKYHTNDKWGAYQMLQKADSLSKGLNPEITYSTALAAFETSKFNEASEYFNNFIKNSTDQSKIIKAQGFNTKIANIKKFMQDSSKVDLTLLSSNINTPNDEFLAFPTLDNETLLFSRRLKNGMNVSELLMKSLQDQKG